MQELIQHVLLFTADAGNIDGVHPVQIVLDCFTGKDKEHFAATVESWFKNYYALRGLPFKPLADCVLGSVRVKHL